jgi:hypothetical protein
MRSSVVRQAQDHGARALTKLSTVELVSLTGGSYQSSLDPVAHFAGT